MGEHIYSDTDVILVNYELMIVQVAAAYKNCSDANIIGNTRRLGEGLIGVDLWSNKDKDAVTSFYFYLCAYDRIKTTQIVDRLAMFSFFDEHPDALVYEDVIRCQALYYSQTHPMEIHCIDFKLLAASLSCSILNRALFTENVYSFYSKFFVDLFSFLGQPAPAVTGTLLPMPTPFEESLVTFKTNNRELHRVCDRVDLMTKLDGLSHKQAVLNAVVKDAPWERVMIIPDEDAYLHIYQEPGMSTPSASALSKYRTVPVDYVIDRSIFETIKS